MQRRSSRGPSRYFRTSRGDQNFGGGAGNRPVNLLALLSCLEQCEQTWLGSLAPGPPEKATSGSECAQKGPERDWPQLRRRCRLDRGGLEGTFRRRGEAAIRAASETSGRGEASPGPPRGTFLRLELLAPHEEEAPAVRARAGGCCRGVSVAARRGPARPESGPGRTSEVARGSCRWKVKNRLGAQRQSGRCLSLLTITSKHETRHSTDEVRSCIAGG
mmetsp:Transcript_61/g.120  ORF Transcript_61/g.120 Transcript_61/m.120 type:complete len:218 (-) Transcript_61:318-971(-)